MIFKSRHRVCEEFWIKMDTWVNYRAIPHWFRKAVSSTVCIVVQSSVFLAIAIAPCWGQVSGQQPDPVRDLKRLSLEDLMNIQVTSVAKKEQPLG